MALVLRKVRGDDWLPGVGDGGRSDDAVAAGHFQDREGVSVWTIDQAQTNLPRILAAIAACRDHLKAVEYLVFSEDLLAELGIPLIQSNGDTPDAQANAEWHRHLEVNSQEEAVRIVQAIRARAFEVQRRSKAQVKALLVESVIQGHISLDDLKEEVRDIVSKAIAQLGPRP